jgi:hypothetical protein
MPHTISKENLSKPKAQINQNEEIDLSYSMPLRKAQKILWLPHPTLSVGGIVW